MFGTIFPTEDTISDYYEGSLTYLDGAELKELQEGESHTVVNTYYHKQLTDSAFLVYSSFVNEGMSMSKYHGVDFWIASKYCLPKNYEIEYGLLYGMVRYDDGFVRGECLVSGPYDESNIRKGGTYVTSGCFSKNRCYS